MNKTSLKRLVGVGLGLAVILLIGACSNDQPAQTQQQYPVVQQPATDPSYALMQETRLRIPSYSTVSDTELLSTANNTCLVLRNGGNVAEFLQRAIINSNSSQFEAQNLGLFVGMSVKHLCPEYASVLQGQITQFLSSGA
jgi:hypothetical protein